MKSATKIECAMYAKRLMDNGCSPEEAAKEAGYKDVRGMNVAIARYAKKLNAVPEEPQKAETVIIEPKPVPEPTPEPTPEPAPPPLKALKLIPTYQGAAHTYEVTGDLVLITTRAGDGMSVRKDHLDALAAELTELSGLIGKELPHEPLY